MVFLLSSRFKGSVPSTGGGSFIIYYTYRSHAYTSERASIRASKVSSSSLASAMDWVFIN